LGRCLIDVELALDWPWIGSWLTSDWCLIDMDRLWIGIALATDSRQNGMVWHLISSGSRLDRHRIGPGLATD